MANPSVNRLTPLLLAIAVSVVASARLTHGEESAKKINFVNDIVPILTKSGCNAGVCHAKAGGGQNGFQLSLLGFEPEQDYQTLVSQGRGRRLFPAAPDTSLLLQKASGQVPHGGGIRLPRDSDGYAMLRLWIEQGTPLSNADDPMLTHIEVVPPSSTVAIGSKQPLRSIAHFSDGTTRDVTNLALYESNQDALAEVSEEGVMQVHDIPGKVAVMVRYQGRVTVHNASIPLSEPTTDPLPETGNFIDEWVLANLQSIGMPISDECDDATFLRRVSLDIAGRLPTLAETRQFLSDENPDKRSVAIDRLLQGGDYADYFANKWTALLKNRRDEASDITSNFAFHAWIRDSLLANKPYDQLVRELLAASGTVLGNPPVAWYKRVKEPKQQMEDVAQLFLGVRMQCAQCHHHPFESWSQADYYSLSAFFTQIGRKPTAVRGEDMIFHQRGMAEAKNPITGEVLRPVALGDSVGDIPPDADPRLRLADWMGDPNNPFFAKALVNRYWKHFFSQGLIEPEDDIRETNPPTNPELLRALEDHFRSSGFDLKELVRVITNSRTYQLSPQPNKQNVVDRQNYSRFYPRRLQAEVMLDAIDRVTESQTSFANLPIGTRAIALPDNSYNKASPFLRVFGRPEGLSVCECERVRSASLAQSLHLMNAKDIKAKLSAPNGTANRLAKDSRSIAEKIDELYLLAFSRYPTPKEFQTAQSYLGEPRNSADNKPLSQEAALQENLQDLIWALINTKEFQFNH
ncbi:MAG: DUF1549 and DUF1553 domain-containing protein [Rubripirellula sp.]|nr:DUF1549 and DUF1553 domain-containing protein [Rubripirellula sp.]